MVMITGLKLLLLFAIVSIMFRAKKDDDWAL